MKKSLLILSLLAIIFSCNTEPKDYATVSGKIINGENVESITILNRQGFKREIPVDENGTFSDTLKIEAGKYMFTDGNEYGNIYLENDNEISFILDVNEFDESLSFKGDGSEKSNFYVKKSLLMEEYLDAELLDKNEKEFDQTFEDLRIAYSELKDSFGLDAEFYTSEDEDFDQTHKVYKDYHNGKLALMAALPKGSPSPTFEDYENYKGGTTSLEDLKGKYVYVDVWATWCGPCKVEIPFLKEVEEKYHGKNIEFVSISIDRIKDHEKWKKMIVEKALGGTQLFADADWKSQFVQDYMIKGIPRFILIDPEGNIVTPDAPRPSSSKLITLFEELKI